jgi:hypothetical protein
MIFNGFIGTTSAATACVDATNPALSASIPRKQEEVKNDIPAQDSGIVRVFRFCLTLKTAVGGEVLREDVEAAGSCEHPNAHLAVRGADGATA